jgi:hypothetical protein
MHLMFRFGEGHGGKQTYTDLYITSSYFVVYKIGQGADSSFDEYVTCDPKNIHPDGCPKIPTHSVLDRMRSTSHVLGKSGYLYTHICVYIYISDIYARICVCCVCICTWYFLYENEPWSSSLPLDHCIARLPTSIFSCLLNPFLSRQWWHGTDILWKARRRGASNIRATINMIQAGFNLSHWKRSDTP